jgi:hypothetical protein
LSDAKKNNTNLQTTLTYFRALVPETPHPYFLKLSKKFHFATDLETTNTLYIEAFTMYMILGTQCLLIKQKSFTYEHLVCILNLLSIQYNSPWYQVLVEHVSNLVERFKSKVLESNKLT